MIAIDTLRAAIPREGLFADKEWLLSPEPFPLERRLAAEIESLGHRLLIFLRACDRFYRRSLNGKLPAWVAGYCDAGKPAGLLEVARSPAFRDALPRVLRPDLLLTDHGLVLTELDSVPGGIGLTAWLNASYTASGAVVGGPAGMLDGFRSILPQGADIVVSKESAGYRPEMEWLAARINARLEIGGGRGKIEAFEVRAAEGYEPRTGRDVYRFFELFDLPQLPAVGPLLSAAAEGRLVLTPPPKPWLEEKLWLALFHLRPLREAWRRELSGNQFRRLAKLIPESWIVDPTPIPHHAVIPRLGIHDWREAAAFTQKERELVLKLSGFHELAWGARSVTVGHDVSQQAWEAAISDAIAGFPGHPYVMQPFHRARVVEHPYFDRESGAVRVMRGRVRLCPYYFVPADGGAVTLGGVLATICPEDKKILHGMRDAILAPCRVVG